MSAWLTAFLGQSRFFIEMTVLGLLYSLPLEKRDRFPLRFGLGTLTGIAVLKLMPVNVAVTFAGGLLLTAGLVILCRRIPFQDGLYCAACAYATQHFAYAASDVLYRLVGWPFSGPEGIEPMLLVQSAVIYAAFYWLFARHLAQGGRYRVDVRRSILSTAMLLAVVLILSSATTSAYDSYGGDELYIICRLYAMFACVFFLGMQVSQVRQSQLQERLAFERQLARQQREQYELSRETIDLINRKCHDLKHQVAALRTCVPEDRREEYLTELDRCVRIYDSTLKTGSDVLDTVLTEKSLYCEAHQIALTCIADGARLAFLDPVDIYTIFGNALDNAIESVSRVDDPEKRVAAVSVTARSGLLIFQFENYYEGTLTFDGDFPQTTKKQDGEHGFGLRSIQYTVEKYGGSMTVHPEGNLFLLRMSIPIPA